MISLQLVLLVGFTLLGEAQRGHIVALAGQGLSGQGFVLPR